MVKCYRCMSAASSGTLHIAHYRTGRSRAQGGPRQQVSRCPVVVAALCVGTSMGTVGMQGAPFGDPMRLCARIKPVVGCRIRQQFASGLFFFIFIFFCVPKFSQFIAIPPNIVMPYSS
jgi:hypothetical protein